MKKIAISASLVVLSAVFCLLAPSAGWGACSATDLNNKSNTGVSIQTVLNQASPGDAIAVTGDCTENLNVNKDNITLFADTSGGPVTITPADPTKIIITVSSRDVTIAPCPLAACTDCPAGGCTSGFTIDGGATLAPAGIFFIGGSGTVYGNTIKNTSIAGIALFGGSALIGYQSAVSLLDSNTPTSNSISANGHGIAVTHNSTAAIIGNKLTSTNGTGNGVMVDRLSQADLAGNTVDGFLNAVLVSANSGVNLSDSSNDLFPTAEIVGPLNETDAGQPNKAFAVACTTGGYVSGYLGSLLPAKIRADSTCINVINPDYA